MTLRRERLMHLEARTYYHKAITLLNDDVDPELIAYVEEVQVKLDEARFPDARFSAAIADQLDLRA